MLSSPRLSSHVTAHLRPGGLLLSQEGRQACIVQLHLLHLVCRVVKHPEGEHMRHAGGRTIGGGFGGCVHAGGRMIDGGIGGWRA